MGLEPTPTKIPKGYVGASSKLAPLKKEKNMAAIEITKETFDEIVKNSDKPVIIDLWAPWCMPCKMLSPILDATAQEYEDKIVIGKINVDDSADVAADLSVMNIPVLIFFDKGEEKGRLTGMVSKEAIDDKITECFKI